MHALTPILVLSTLFSTSLAKIITIEGRYWTGNDVVHIGNTNCGQDVYHFKNSVCDGNAKIHLGDIVPPGCSPPGHTYENLVAKGSCKAHFGHQFV
ncbi:hypothetical protein DE146DRAFT_58320 [Phaeosphaeria sp. MPI-PUGE-AT-0046c]|nr:hypothetical protein DE146DRAFT_58320 [Phaeosphaeria sp. MPI-PUGE-AT-0046c]